MLHEHGLTSKPLPKKRIVTNSAGTVASHTHTHHLAVLVRSSCGERYRPASGCSSGEIALCQSSLIVADFFFQTRFSAAVIILLSSVDKSPIS
jgi:DeoR/GlpR family transcriptional regulator of sugar metabolism